MTREEIAARDAEDVRRAIERRLVAPNAPAVSSNMEASKP